MWFFHYSKGGWCLNYSKGLKANGHSVAWGGGISTTTRA
ncbi:hypothetical protein PF008_g25738 [Phytophthora fragariae]|uniref:Uncharacterized protein n=1 Tax=Phytophthora fragariae TaxID=53985 RepID=A0A6G0QJV4_9STRA|nr:hypothetical protein PF008_g25738 [Phytophthora fragariae]